MPNQEFIETYPLFKKLKITLPRLLIDLDKPPIHMYCETCRTDQTFIMTNSYLELFANNNVTSSDENVRMRYKCQFCKNFERIFYIHLSRNLDFCYKIGQYPSWEINIDGNLEKTLGEHSRTFKKGLVCESQGYGIGAFAYYRRITEDIIDELLESIFDLVEENNKDKYKSAIEETKKTRITQEKIDLVKDLLPSILRPGGYNPLGVLHSELSEGLHTQTDEVCLEKAAHIRDILTFLVNQIIQSKEAAKSFTSSMQALLDKKTKRI